MTDGQLDTILNIVVFLYIGFLVWLATRKV
ncbi:hypothetical protein CLV88_108133 [Shimia abyssi]|uniref:Uncharacterized protein n=1 Tax=Shimia abyssi TaxID=1662395 RepID=A0A2P8FB67_9RHOB|nr:hypothetical protein CLV88_108133 [Shimia abyssi]